jgi:hypothetical protein
MLFYPVTFLLLLVTFVMQEFIPGIPMAHHATLFLPPVFFFAASVAVPFPVMLLQAFVAGTLWDARHMHAGAATQAAQTLMTGTDELSATGFGLGISFFLFGVLGMFLQGVRPLFKRGQLQLPVFMVGFTTSLWLLAEYLLLTLGRGSFYFPTAIWTKIITAALLAMLAAPLLFLLLYTLAGLSRYEIRYEGLRLSFDGR